MSSEPMFNIREKLPVWLAGLFVVIHIIAHYGPIFIASPIAQYGVLRPLGAGGTSTLSQITSLFGHGFLHGSWSHLLMNSGMLIAFGVVTIRGIRMMAVGGRQVNVKLTFLMIFLLGVAAGGITEWVLWALTGANSAVLGASGGVSALFATMAWAIGGRAQMFRFGMAWAFLNVIFAVAGPLMFGSGIAWAAHMGGYVGGMIMAPFWVRAHSTGFSIS